MAAAAIFEGNIDLLVGGRGKRTHQQDARSTQVLRGADKRPALIVKLRLDPGRKAEAPSRRFFGMTAHDLPPPGQRTPLELTRWNVVAVVHVV
jgi:hypothetical protein